MQSPVKVTITERSSGASVGMGVGVDVGVGVNVGSVETVSSIIVVGADCSTAVFWAVPSVPAGTSPSSLLEHEKTDTDNAAITDTAIIFLTVPGSRKLPT